MTLNHDLSRERTLAGGQRDETAAALPPGRAPEHRSKRTTVERAPGR